MVTRRTTRTDSITDDGKLTPPSHVVTCSVLFGGCLLLEKWKGGIIFCSTFRNDKKKEHHRLLFMSNHAQQINFRVTRADICGFCVHPRTYDSSLSANMKIEKIVPKKDTTSNDVDLRVKRARTSAEITRCTNVPVDCTLCSTRKKRFTHGSTASAHISGKFTVG